MKSVWVLMPLISALIVGCSDRGVPAGGQVLIEGEPAGHGQLVLNPVEKGPKAFGVVNEAGEFQLRSAESPTGVIPGSYHVLFKQDLNLDERAQSRLERRVGLDLDEVSITYLSPRKTPLVVPQEGASNLVIDVRKADGWIKSAGD